MEKKTKSAKNQQSKHTTDIRSFFHRDPAKVESDFKPVKSEKSHKPVALSSSEESPVKKNGRHSESKRSERMPKRKTAVIDSDSTDDEVIVRPKKSKKSHEPAAKSKASKSGKRKLQIESDSDSDFVVDEKPSNKRSHEPAPKSKASTSGKRKLQIESDSDSDFVLKEKPSNKKSPPAKSKKSIAATKKPKATAASKKAAASKNTTSKENKSKSKSKSLVKPLDDESDEEALECKVVKKNQAELIKPGFSTTSKGSLLSKIDGDKKTSQLGAMWVDKYKPTKVQDVVGQHTPKASAVKLKNWLMDWHKNKEFKPKFGAKNETGIGLRAALLSGPPGIGK